MIHSLFYSLMLSLNRLNKQLSEILSWCPVCINPFSQRNKIMIACKEGHRICEECINKLPVMDGFYKSCPTCRQIFRISDVRVCRVSKQLASKLLPLTKDLKSLESQRNMADPHKRQNKLKETRQDQKGEQGEKGRKRVHLEGQTCEDKIEWNCYEMLEETAQMLVSDADTEETIVHFRKAVTKLLQSDQEDSRFIGLGNIQEVDGIYQGKSKLETINEMGLFLNALSPYDLLSYCCMFSEKTEEHLSWYEVQIEMHPEKVELIFARANLEYLCGEYQDAIKDYEKAYHKFPHCQRIVQGLLMALYQTEEDNEERIQAVIHELSEIAPQNKFLKFHTKELSNQDMTRLYRNFEENPYFLLKLARKYSSKGQYKQSNQLIKEVLELNPHYEKAYYYEGLNFMETEDYLSATDSFKEYLKRPNQRVCCLSSLYFELGICQKNIDRPHRYQFALKMFEKSNQIKPNEDSLYWIPYCYYQLQEYELALRQMLQFEQHYPNYDDNFYLIGKCFKRLKRYHEAIEYFERSIRQKNFTRSYPLVAECYRMLMNYEEAFRYAKNWEENQETQEGVKRAHHYLYELQVEKQRLARQQDAEKWDF